MTEATELLEGHLLGEEDWIAVETLCRACNLSLDAMMELAELGALSPKGRSPREWELPATALPRLKIMARLMRDLGLNVSGAALALELIETQRRLERRLRELERYVTSGR
jgi:chaperone modulatory protein CbpM